MPLRHRIAHHLMRWSIRLTTPQPTIEGMFMSTIKDRLAALEARCAALESRSGDHEDTLTNVATKDDVAAVSATVQTLPTKDDVAAVSKSVDAVASDVATINGEIGADPAPQSNAGSDTTTAVSAGADGSGSAGTDASGATVQPAPADPSASQGQDGTLAGNDDASAQTSFTR